MFLAESNAPSFFEHNMKFYVIQLRSLKGKPKMRHFLSFVNFNKKLIFSCQCSSQ